MRRTAYGVAVASLLIANTAQAEFTIKDVFDKENEKSAPFYISGAYTALLWYNNMLRKNNVSPLFCEPQDRDLTNDEVTEILKRFTVELESTEAKDRIISLPASLILLHALQKEFPCALQNSIKLNDVCKMTDSQANSSSNCLRYYFFCKSTTKSNQSKSPSSQPLPPNIVLRAMGEIALIESEKNCENFDYSQAYSAYHLLVDGH